MALAQTRLYTEDDYYNLPENIRAELINGQFFTRRHRQEYIRPY